MKDFISLGALRDRLEWFEPIDRVSLFRECQPKILVVTDGLSFDPAAGFGLTQFVGTLAASLIHGMLPHVVKASRRDDSFADLKNFRFDDAANGITKARYDVLFMLGFNGEGDLIAATEISAIARFMQAGGGVFATGDHQDLGAAMGRDVPRVRSMRFWTTSTPHVSNENRLSTNMSGTNEVEDFDDQSDTVPQNLYPNFRTNAGNPTSLGRPAKAHPLLQVPAFTGVPFPVVEVFPDHPHEGECHLPASEVSQFQLDGATLDEWPVGTGGSRILPEAVAMTMSHGSGFADGPTGPKTALTPRAFIAICAYDGQLSSVGRVVTDATWHHFVNINLDGSGSGRSGLQIPGTPPTDTPALQRIRQYYRNLATWLMPKNTRRCLRFQLIIPELVRFPLFEELDLPRPPEPDPLPFVRAGELVASSIARRHPAWVAETLLLDCLEEAVGGKLLDKLLRQGPRTGKLSTLDLAHCALGAAVSSVADTLSHIERPTDIKPHETFERAMKQHVSRTVLQLVEWQRKELKSIDLLLAEMQEGSKLG